MSDYTTQVLGATLTPNNAEWRSMQMEQLDRQLRKMKKQKKGKKGKKGKGRKKLKKRIRALEQDYQQLNQLILFAMYQGQMQIVQPLQQPWWQKAVTDSLPKALELATVSMRRLPPRNQLPPKSQTPLALPAARGQN